MQLHWAPGARSQQTDAFVIVQHLANLMPHQNFSMFMKRAEARPAVRETLLAEGLAN